MGPAQILPTAGTVSDARLAWLGCSALEPQAREILATLPLAKLGMLHFEVYGTNPYRGLVRSVT